MTLISDDLDTVEETLTVDTKEKKKRSWLKWASIGAVAVLLVAIIVNMFIPLPVLSGKAGSELAAQIEARDEICAFAPSLATYDYKDLNPYYETVLKHSTGDFKSQFSKGRPELTEWLKQGQVISTVHGVACGVQAVGGQIGIVIGLAQSVNSTAAPTTPSQATLSVVATVEKIDGKWMIRKLEGPLIPE